MGVFLRTGRERALAESTLSLGDPARICHRVDEYFELASKFKHVVTDRLHFCLAALLLGREATLLPNSYFKNRAFFETWLQDLCGWRDDLGGMDYDKDRVTRALFDRLVAPPSRLIPWNLIPIRQSEFSFREFSAPPVLYADATRLECSNTTAAAVWQLCDGHRTLRQVTSELVEQLPEEPLRAARDVQNVIHQLRVRGGVLLDGTP